jgi:DNA-binding MarR family transcriptional regulator
MRMAGFMQGSAKARARPDTSADDRGVDQSAPDGSPFLSRFLGTHLRATHALALAALERAFAPLRMSPTRYSILVHASERPGITQTRLAELVGADRTTIVPMLRGMERLGYVRRARARQDRRATEVRITPRGRAILRKLVPLAVEHERRMVRDLQVVDQEALLRALEKLRSNLAGG